MSNKVKVKEEDVECLHMGRLEYLSGYPTPYLHNYKSQVVYVHMFLCNDCKAVIRKDIIVPKPLPDSMEVTPEMREEILKSKEMLMNKQMEGKRDGNN